MEFSGNCDDNGEFTFEVSAIFHRDSSWVVARQVDARLLEHEQGHFDLAEIYARRLSRALRGLPEACEDIEETRTLIQTLLNLNQQELEEEQRRYDIETRHGTSKRKQGTWTDALRRRLFVTETSAENRETP